MFRLITLVAVAAALAVSTSDASACGHHLGSRIHAAVSKVTQKVTAPFKGVGSNCKCANCSGNAQAMVPPPVVKPYPMPMPAQSAPQVAAKVDKSTTTTKVVTSTSTASSSTCANGNCSKAPVATPIRDRFHAVLTDNIATRTLFGRGTCPNCK